jgi:hypothetical protein
VKDLLAALGATRAEASQLELEIKAAEEPFKSQIEKITGEARAKLRALRTAEGFQAATATTVYLALAKARAAAMAAHPDAPPPVIGMPTGCGVKWVSAVEVLDPALLPRHVLVPDKKLLKDAFGEGAVPGAVLQQHPIFEFRTAKPKTVKDASNEESK